MRFRKIYLLTALALLMTGGLSQKAWREFQNPPPPRWVDAVRWTDDASSAAAWAIIGVASVIYVRRTARSARDPEVPARVPWRDRPELRFVLYAFSTVLFLQLPSAVYRTALAVADTSGPAPPPAFVSAFPWSSVVPAVFGISLIAYDRYRLRREDRAAGNLCAVCGYDLRATPTRCPECGTVVVNVDQRPNR